MRRVLTWSTMDGKEVYQGGIFLIFRDSIVAILLLKHLLKHLRFYTAIRSQTRTFSRGIEAIRTSSSCRISAILSAHLVSCDITC